MARPGRPRMPKAPLPGSVEAFLDMLIAERGAAMNTRHAYERDLADVCAFLKMEFHCEWRLPTISVCP